MRDLYYSEVDKITRLAAKVLHYEKLSMEFHSQIEEITGCHHDYPDAGDKNADKYVREILEWAKEYQDNHNSDIDTSIPKAARKSLGERVREAVEKGPPGVWYNPNT